MKKIGIYSFIVIPPIILAVAAAEDLLTNFKGINFFSIMNILLIIGVIATYIYYFRIVKFDHRGVISTYPFRGMKQQILWRADPTIKWKVEKGKKTPYYRVVEIEDRTSKITISDFTFANFDSLTDQIPNGRQLRREIDIEQAENNWALAVGVLVSLLPFVALMTWALVGAFNSKDFMLYILFFALWAGVITLVNKSRCYYAVLQDAKQNGSIRKK